MLQNLYITPVIIYKIIIFIVDSEQSKIYIGGIRHFSVGMLQFQAGV